MILKTKELDNFIRETDKHLLCSKKTKRKFLSELKNDAYDYAESNKVLNLDDIYNHFGKPEEIAKGFNDEIDSKQLKKAIDWKRIIIISFTITIVLLFVYLIVALVDVHLNARGYGFETNITKELLIDWRIK